jgi:hypothetical protein
VFDGHSGEWSHNGYVRAGVASGIVAGNLHAVLLIVVITIPLVVFLTRRHLVQQETRLRQRALTAALGASAIVLLCGTFIHMCGAGQPLTQWLVPAVSWSVVGSLPLSVRIRRAVFVGLFVVACILTGHYMVLVHGEEYTGNPSWARLTPGAGVEIMVDSDWHTRLTGLYRLRKQEQY